MTKHLPTFLFLISLVGVVSCSNDEEDPAPIAIENLLGTWEWDATSVNGASSADPPCCVTLIFQSRDFSQLSGQFTITENGFTGVGSFQITETNQLITTIDDQTRSFSFELSETRLSLIYEENGDDVIDGYFKL